MTTEERIFAYEVDTDFLEISGMEYIEMLYNRSEIALIEASLSEVQRARLRQADQCLLRAAHLFYAAIQSIADLRRWRERDHRPPEQWWWYLDVLAAAPMISINEVDVVPA